MGYQTYFNGFLEITPPDAPDDLQERLLAATEGSGIWDDTLSVKRTPAAEGAPPKTEVWISGEMKYEEEVREYMEAVLGALPQRYRASGEVYGEGSESEDFWRYVIKDNEITYQEGRVTYE